jgi:hypothetical protein
MNNLDGLLDAIEADTHIATEYLFAKERTVGISGQPIRPPLNSRPR